MPYGKERIHSYNKPKAYERKERTPEIRRSQRTTLESRPLNLHAARLRDYGYGHTAYDIYLNIAKQDTKYHVCNLMGEPRDITNVFIEGGIFVQLRRKWRRFTMISSRHPFTKYYAVSITRLKEEEKRHLIFYYYKIYPLSMFSFYVDILISFALLLNMIATPLAIIAFRSDRFRINPILVPMTVVYIILIVVTFITGHYDMEKNIVVLRFCDVAIHYIQTYFIFDLLQILPQVITFYTVFRNGMVWKVEDNLMAKIAAPIVTLSVYPRYFWCLRVLAELRIYSGLSTYVYMAIKLILTTIMIINTSVYILYILMREVPGYINESLLKHIKRTISIIFLVGYGRPMYKESEYNLIPIIFIFVGFLLSLVLMVQGMEILYKYFSIENKQRAIYTSTEAYMRYRGLPIELRKKICLYLDFKYQGYFYKDSVIRKSTSPALRKEIHLHVASESIQRVELFDKCPGLVMNKIRASLVSEIFLPGDVIIKAGSKGHCMFFILSGTVVVTSAENKPLSYLRDGAHFGEIALVTNIARVANVIAVTPCEVYKLDRYHFWEVMKYHPKLWTEIKQMATDRVTRTSRSIVDNSLFNRNLSRSDNDGAEDLQFQIVGDASFVSLKHN